MGILDSIGIGKPRTPAMKTAGPSARAGSAANESGAAMGRPGATRPQGSGSGARPNTKLSPPGKGRKRGRRGGAPSVRERVATAAAPLHDRRRRLVAARESTLRDLGGLMLEMYKRNRFREELLLDKCEEVLAIEVEVAHVDQRLFQLAPPNAAGMRPIGRCECGAPIHPGQNFCGVCGRGFSTLTQARACTRCGSGLRAGDQFCGTCGHEAPDMLQSIEAPGPGASSAVPAFDAAAVAASAVADTIIIEAPPLDEASSPAAASSGPASAESGRDTVPMSGAAHQSTTPDHGSDGGFDWSTPPVIPDAAIDAALEAPASTPAGTTSPFSTPPFSGFPLNAAMPPPPVVDPNADGASTTVTPITPASKTAEATADSPASSRAGDQAPPKPTAASQRQRIKEAKARAKERAKAARASRKRGDA